MPPNKRASRARSTPQPGRPAVAAPSVAPVRLEPGDYRLVAELAAGTAALLEAVDDVEHRRDAVTAAAPHAGTDTLLETMRAMQAAIARVAERSAETSQALVEALLQSSVVQQDPALAKDASRAFATMRRTGARDNADVQAAVLSLTYRVAAAALSGGRVPHGARLLSLAEELRTTMTDADARVQAATAAVRVAVTPRAA